MKFNTLLWLLTTGLQFAVGWWYRRQPVFFLPQGWLGPLGWWLALPFAPAGMSFFSLCWHDTIRQPQQDFAMRLSYEQPINYVDVTACVKYTRVHSVSLILLPIPLSLSEHSTCVLLFSRFCECRGLADSLQTAHRGW